MDSFGSAFSQQSLTNHVGLLRQKPQNGFRGFWDSLEKLLEDHKLHHPGELQLVAPFKEQYGRRNIAVTG